MGKIRILLIVNNLVNPVHKMKNVAQGRFEYSHSPDNRALKQTKPRDYVSGCKLLALQPILKLFPLATEMHGRNSSC